VSGKKVLIVEADLLDQIDANRGELSREEFLCLLIDAAVGREETPETFTGNNQYLEREEFEKFTCEMKELLRRFLDFFVSSNIDLKAAPQETQIEELAHKLQSISRNNGGKGKYPR
jgi:hypothetical protein